MQYENFMGLVQDKARLTSTDETDRAVRATLSTLGARLYGQEASHVAAQLPDGITSVGNMVRPVFLTCESAASPMDA